MYVSHTIYVYTHDFCVDVNRLCTHVHINTVLVCYMIRKPPHALTFPVEVVASLRLHCLWSLFAIYPWIY